MGSLPCWPTSSIFAPRRQRQSTTASCCLQAEMQVRRVAKTEGISKWAMLLQNILKQRRWKIFVFHTQIIATSQKLYFPFCSGREIEYCISVLPSWLVQTNIVVVLRIPPYIGLSETGGCVPGNLGIQAICRFTRLPSQSADSQIA